MLSDGWEVVLFEAIAEKESEPFCFGKFDCCTGAAFILHELHGIDLMHGLRGYRSASGALKTIKKNGGSLLEVVRGQCSAFGWAEKPRAFAARGDLVVADIPAGDGINEACGVVTGVNAVFPSEIGWVNFPVSKCKAVFSYE